MLAQRKYRPEFNVAELVISNNKTKLRKREDTHEQYIFVSLHRSHGLSRLYRRVERRR